MIRAAWQKRSSYQTWEDRESGQPLSSTQVIDLSISENYMFYHKKRLQYFTDPGVKDTIDYTIARDTMHRNQWIAAIEELKEIN